MFSLLVRLFRLMCLKNSWRKGNSHNKTTIGRVCNLDVLTVGSESYGVLNVYTWGAPNEGLVIGCYVSIASDVKFILGGNHFTEGYTTFPIKSKVRYLSPEIDATSKGEIYIDDDVWIGIGAIILSGVKIGRSSIIAAGSVVTRSFPPYSIIGGNPARLLKTRLTDEERDFAECIDFNKINLSSLSDDEIEAFYNRDKIVLSKFLS